MHPCHRKCFVLCGMEMIILPQEHTHVNRTDSYGDGSETAFGIDLQATREGLRRLDRRDWSLWIAALTVMLVLTAGVYSFTLSEPQVIGRWSLHNSKTAVYGLFALVAIFAVFAIYKQLLMNRLRRRMAEQMNMLAAMQTRAELFHKLAVLDPLTGLYNRRYLLQQLPIELARTQRHESLLTLVMLDVNGLKQINDTHSHLAGDVVLREFANALRRAIRSSDVAVRLGGDEFLVILPECGTDVVPHVLARLQSLRADFRGKAISVEFSAGWTEYIPGETSEQLLARADALLYEDKRTGTARDRAKKAQEQRNESEKMEVVGRVTSGVVHDFNNLLTIVRGYTQLLLETTPLDEHTQQYVESIDKAAARASQLTGQLQAFSRRHTVQPERVALNTLLYGMELMLGRIVGRQVSVTLQPGSDLHAIYADPGQIEQLVLHLASSAREHMPQGGRLVLETCNFEMDESYVAGHPGSRPGPYVCMNVRDTGEGMDAETRTHLFDPVLTVSEPGKSARLGLASVYGIVKQYGGYIWVNSEPGFGTCISVYLPRADVHRVSEPTTPVEVVDDGTPTVLVVEPLDSLRQFTCEFLRMAHYRVLQAASGDQAIELAGHQNHIDLVVCGVILPGMSGLELAECVARSHPGVQVLYVAGDEGDAALCPEWLRNSEEFVTAPFDPQQFSNRVAALIGKAHNYSREHAAKEVNALD